MEKIKKLKGKNPKVNTIDLITKRGGTVSAIIITDEGTEYIGENLDFSETGGTNYMPHANTDLNKRTNELKEVRKYTREKEKSKTIER